MEACNDRYFFVPRLFGIGPRSSKPRPRPKLSSFTIQRWRLFARSVRLRQRPLGMALCILSLKEGGSDFWPQIIIMTNQHAGDSLAASMRELCSRFSFREILLATIIARWRRQRMANSASSLPAWLRHDLALSDD